MTQVTEMGPSDEATTTPLHEFVWMAQEVGLVPPPVPQDYVSRFLWNGQAHCLWTNPALLPCLTEIGLLSELSARRWPITGMAMRFSNTARWAHWTCLLVGARSLVLIDLRLPVVTPNPVYLSEANATNQKLARHLSDEIVLSGYLSEGPPGPEAISRGVIYSNPTGLTPDESHFRYSANAGVSETERLDEIFADGPAGQFTVSAGETPVIFHP